ncbi:O-antigen ligase family protein [Halegenticoccus soli]|uniref:O-antigen ligase family protein n=1 Tax=Halegenticoccus soli TaxID=1985678 RepID=UPI000C6DD328|nr:O-antigen ligase family protein [Halegenticoccus soli]
MQMRQIVKGGSFPTTAVDRALVWLLLATVFSQYTGLLPEPIDTLSIVCAFALVPAYYLIRSNFTLRVPLETTALVGAITLLFGFHLLTGHYSNLEYGLLPVYTSVVVIAGLVFLPQLVDSETLLTHVAIFGALVGLFGALVWATGTGDAFHMFSHANKRSIFNDPNTLGLLAFVGFVGSLGAFSRTRSRRAAGLVVANLVFVGITVSRGVWLAVAAALCVLALDALFSRRIAAAAVSAGVLTTAAVTALVVTLPVETTLFLPLTNRQYLWQATVEATYEAGLFTGAGFYMPGPHIRPFVEFELEAGKSLGPHNSYLLVFFYGGVVGLVLYLHLLWGTIARAFRDPRVDVLLVALAVGFGANLFFEGYSFWSVGMHGVLLTLAFGALAWESTNRVVVVDVRNLTSFRISRRNRSPGL